MATTKRSQAVALQFAADGPAWGLQYRPPTACLIRRTLRLAKGSAAPDPLTAGTLTRDRVRDIAVRKPPDIITNLAAAMRLVAGTARSMRGTGDHLTRTGGNGSWRAGPHPFSR